MKQPNRLWAALLFGAIVLSGWTAYSGLTRTASGAVSDMETMLDEADRLYASGYAVVLQHSGPYREARSDAAFGALGDEAAALFGLPASKPVRDANGHRIYNAAEPSGAENEGRLEIALSGWEDGTTNLLVRWNAPEGTEKDKLLAWGENAASRLERLGVKAQWMITLRGGAGALTDGERTALMDKVAGAYKAEPVESYSDSGSEIVSYSSRLLQSGIRSAGGQVNLQVSLHRDSIYGTYRLTVATPLIVAEP